MLHETQPQIAVWTETGRDDRAAEVALLPHANGSWQVVIDAPTAAITYLALRWDTPLPEGSRILGDGWERGYGDLEWRGVVAERTLPWYALAYDPKNAETRGFGVATGAASFASWRIDETGATLVLDVRCGGKGVLLGSRRLTAAIVRELASTPSESPYSFARRFCRALCSSPRLPERPLYGGNDWYSRYGNITAETVRQDCALIRELSPSLDNAPVCVIDAGWYSQGEGNTCDAGVFDRGNAGFPDLPGLAEEMRGMGTRPGIWIRPLLTAAAVPLTWQVAPEHPHSGKPGAFLDPSVPEVLAHVRTDIARLVEWGYGILKHDFTTYDITGRWGFEMGPEITPGGWTFADRTRTTAEIVGNLYAAIREAAGEAKIIGCNTVGHLGAGLFELQRTGDDTSGRHWERTRKMGINTLAFRMPQQETFFCADADCVGLRPEIAWEQNRQWLDLLSRSGTALFVSAHPEAVGQEQRAALREAFARAALPMTAAEPLDWMETTSPRRWLCQGETQIYDWSPFPGAAFACPG